MLRGTAPTLAAMTAVSLCLGLAEAQVCRLSVAGLNRARRVVGPVHAECPETGSVHTPPFGNWGVSSNFGKKINGHQFDGWCHDSVACDNGGGCSNVCRDGWYEWNSCTDHSLYQPPNCSLFNSAACTEQASTMGVNVLNTENVDVPVACPSSSAPGLWDKGGCNEVKQYSSGVNYMSIYELDPAGRDDLIQTLYFPEITLQLRCDAFGCADAGSQWLAPVAYDSPASPPKIFAEMAVVANWGAFRDENRRCSVTGLILTSVSAASYSGPNLAPDSIASAFGDSLAPVTAQATSEPLPTSLAGVTIKLADSAGRTRDAPLFFVSPTQINFVVPAGTANGKANTYMYRGDTPIAMGGLIQVESVAPGIFTQNQDGRGAPAAIVQRYSPDGSVVTDFAFECGPAAGSCVPKPIDLGGEGDRVYLILFGTGIRHNAGLTSVAVTFNGDHAAAEYAGAQGQFTGLDQVNIPIPRQYRGRGAVNVQLVVAGKPSNVVQVVIR